MSPDSADIVGIIYSKDTADSVYGEVLESVSIKSSELLSLFSSSGSFMMFNLINGSVTITGESRQPLQPADADFPDDQVFHYFSVSKISELLNLGDAAETKVEIRRDVLTLTNGSFTMENATLCPPYCP